MVEKLLFESTNDNLVAQVCEILKEKNINYIRRNEGSDAYLNIVYGSNTLTKILVNDKDYEQAKKILEIFNSEEAPEELREDKESDEENNKEIKKYRTMKRIIACIPFIMTIIAVILLIIASVNN